MARYGWLDLTNYSFEGLPCNLLFQDRDKKRGNSVDSASNPSSEEESEIDMNETRRRMHAMLDDAFSLLGPQSAKKPEKIPEGHPSHPVPHPTQVYSSTPARPAVIPR